MSQGTSVSADTFRSEYVGAGPGAPGTPGGRPRSRPGASGPLGGPLGGRGAQARIGAPVRRAASLSFLPSPAQRIRAAMAEGRAEVYAEGALDPLGGPLGDPAGVLLTPPSSPIGGTPSFSRKRSVRVLARQVAQQMTRSVRDSVRSSERGRGRGWTGGGARGYARGAKGMHPAAS